MIEPRAFVACASVRGRVPGYAAAMEREKGEYLDMDEDKRQELDQQAEEYVDDVAEQPAMNAEPAARYPDHGTAEPAKTAEPTES